MTDGLIIGVGIGLAVIVFIYVGNFLYDLQHPKPPEEGESDGKK